MVLPGLLNLLNAAITLYSLTKTHIVVLDDLFLAQNDEPYSTQLSALNNLLCMNVNFKLVTLLQKN